MSVKYSTRSQCSTLSSASLHFYLNTRKKRGACTIAHTRCPVLCYPVSLNFLHPTTRHAEFPLSPSPPTHRHSVCPVTLPHRPSTALLLICIRRVVPRRILFHSSLCTFLVCVGAGHNADSAPKAQNSPVPLPFEYHESTESTPLSPFLPSHITIINKVVENKRPHKALRL